ncbi:MAG: HDOD domain-containing protein [Sulfuricella denitrificans]|nr:HDOD domain-containing protein [Sulfuricella denitrificans]
MLEKYLKFLKSGREDGPANRVSGTENVLSDAPDEPRMQPGADAITALDALDQVHEGDAAEKWRLFLGRQPILDDVSQFIGYELKLQDRDFPPCVGDETALRQVQDELLVISVIDLDFQKVLGSGLVFIQVSPGMLDNPIIESLPKQKVVVGICLKDVAGESLLQRCRELVALGIPLALEDFEFRVEYAPFLALCSWVKIDTSRYDALTLGQLVGAIQDSGKPGLIAQKVELDDAFEACRKLGFPFFQGAYFSRLQAGAPQRLDHDRMRVIEMLNLVMNHAELSALEEKVKLDPGLSYKLLNFINSPANGLQQKIRSIGHGLTLLGYDQLYRWLTLLLFTSGKADGRSRALLRNALVRARFTETLGQNRFEASKRGGLFIVGIFSLLDALLNVPMAQALSRLNLPDAVVEALLHRTGQYAPYLLLATACENFDQEAIARHAAACGLTADEVNVTHVKALIWGEEVDV